VGAAWPEARVDYTVQPASSRLTLLGFTHPPNPRVGDDVTVMYVVKNNGPDAVTGLKLFTRADSRLDFYRYTDPNPPVPPVPGPFAFGDVLPPDTYTYQRFRYSVKAAGDLTNYFTVEYQDQLIPNAADHPELSIPIKTLPSDVGLSLDANPKDITVPLGDPVTIEFQVHNDGPQAARGIFVDYSSLGLDCRELDEVIHADRTLRPGASGYIDIVEAGRNGDTAPTFRRVDLGCLHELRGTRLFVRAPGLAPAHRLGSNPAARLARAAARPRDLGQRR
jgi:hypothetical protein